MKYKTNQAWVLILLTPLFFYMTRALAFFVHEYAHSFSAWVLGFKHNPLILNFGDASWGNILLYTKIDENVDFNSFSGIHPWSASFIAFAGILSNAILFIISVKALFSKKNHSQLYYYFFLWFTVINLGNFNTYIPARTFSHIHDIGEITTFLNISPWWIMILFGYAICYCFWFFYSEILPYGYKKLSFNSIQQIILLIMVTFILFAVTGTSGYTNHGPESHFIALLSLYAIPIVIISCWPSRKWVLSKL